MVKTIGQESDSKTDGEACQDIDWEMYSGGNPSQADKKCQDGEPGPDPPVVDKYGCRNGRQNGGVLGWKRTEAVYVDKLMDMRQNQKWTRVLEDEPFTYGGYASRSRDNQKDNEKTARVFLYKNKINKRKNYQKPRHIVSQKDNQRVDKVAIAGKRIKKVKYPLVEHLFQEKVFK